MTSGLAFSMAIHETKWGEEVLGDNADVAGWETGPVNFERHTIGDWAPNIYNARKTEATEELAAAWGRSSHTLRRKMSVKSPSRRQAGDERMACELSQCSQVKLVFEALGPASVLSRTSRKHVCRLGPMSRPLARFLDNPPFAPQQG